MTIDLETSKFMTFFFITSFFFLFLAAVMSWSDFSKQESDNAFFRSVFVSLAFFLNAVNGVIFMTAW